MKKIQTIQLLLVISLAHLAGAEEPSHSERLLQRGYACETLHVLDSTLSDGARPGAEAAPASLSEKERVAQGVGSGFRFGGGSKGDDFVQGWVNANQFVTWKVRADQAVAYWVSIEYKAEKESDGNKFVV